MSGSTATLAVATGAAEQVWSVHTLTVTEPSPGAGLPVPLNVAEPVVGVAVIVSGEFCQLTLVEEDEGVGTPHLSKTFPAVPSLTSSETTPGLDSVTDTEATKHW